MKPGCEQRPGGPPEPAADLLTRHRRECGADLLLLPNKTHSNVHFEISTGPVQTFLP